MNNLGNLFYYENVSNRLANNLMNILHINCTFNQLIKYEKILLKRIISKSNKKELIEMLELIKNN